MFFLKLVFLYPAVTKSSEKPIWIGLKVFPTLFKEGLRRPILCFPLGWVQLTKVPLYTQLWRIRVGVGLPQNMWDHLKRFQRAVNMNKALEKYWNPPRHWVDSFPLAFDIGLNSIGLMQSSTGTVFLVIVVGYFGIFLKAYKRKYHM